MTFSKECSTLILEITNNGKYYNVISFCLNKWVNGDLSEKQLNEKLDKLVETAFLHFSDINPEVDYKFNESLKSTYIGQLKTHYIDLLYREVGEIQKIYNARFREIVNNKITIAAFTCKEKYPHLAVVLHTITKDSDNRCCHVANLDCGGFSSGVYGQDAKTAFLERVNSCLA